MKTKTTKNSWLGYQARSFALTAFVGLSVASQLSYGAVSMTYDAGSSGANLYVYNGTARAGTPISVELSFSFWDDSASSFVTPTYTPQTGGGVFRGSIDLAIDPGDYMCVSHRITDGNGNPTTLGVYDSNHPSWTAGDTAYIMSTSMYVLGMNPYMDEVSMIYNPDGSAFYDVAGQADGIFVQAATTDSTTSTQTFQTPDAITRGVTDFGAAFDDINNLTGADTTSYTYAGLLPDGNQKADIIDKKNDGVNTTTTGFSWYLANTGSQSIASGTVFGFTMDGAVVPVPEPSSTALLGLTSLALVLRRKRS